MPDTDFAIHQVVFGKADGVRFEQAQQLQAFFSGVCTSRIFVTDLSVRNPIAESVSELDRLTPSQCRNTTLVIHAAVGCPEMLCALRDLGARIVLIVDDVLYGDMTFFGANLPLRPTNYITSAQRVSLPFVSAQEMLADLLAFIDIAAMVICTSSAMRAELERLGFRDVHLVGPELAWPGDDGPLPRQSTLDHLAGYNAPVIYCPGPILPHRRLHTVVAAYHVLTTYLSIGAALILEGPQPDRGYAELISLQINELNLTRTWMTESQSFEDHMAFLAVASVGISLSAYGESVTERIACNACDIPFVSMNTPFADELRNTGNLQLSEDALAPTIVAEALHSLIPSTVSQRCRVPCGVSQPAEELGRIILSVSAR